MKVVLLAPEKIINSTHINLYKAIAGLFNKPKYDVVIDCDEKLEFYSTKLADTDLLIAGDTLFYNISQNKFQKIIKRLKCYKIYISFDDEYLFGQTLYMSQFFDSIITFDPVSNEYLKQIGVPTIFCPHPIYKPENFIPNQSSNNSFLHDISFVGDIDGKKFHRYDFLAHLKSIFPKIYISGLNGKKLTYSEMLDVFGKSKINLNFSGISNSQCKINPPFQKIRRGFKGRPFEIGLGKGFCVSEYSPSIAYFLKDGKHLSYFNNFNELESVISYYLKNDLLRIQMTNKLHQLVLDKYTQNSLHSDMREMIIEVYKSRPINRVANLLSCGKIDYYKLNDFFSRAKYAIKKYI